MNIVTMSEEERRSRLRDASKKELAKLRRILSSLTNAIVRDDREKIDKWQRLLLKYYNVVDKKGRLVCTMK